MLSDAELDRYSRHLLLPELDFNAQLQFKQARVVIVGVGGLGATVAMQLAAAGVGCIRLIDNDVVELSNLQRQLLYREVNIGQAKVIAAAQQLQQLNRHVLLEPTMQRLQPENIESLLADVDLVLDCSDHLPTRYLVNHFCQRRRIGLIQGSALQWQGEVIELPFQTDNGGCYQCIYGPLQPIAVTGCHDSGVLAPLLMVIGGLQAQRALQFLIAQQPTGSNLLRYDAKRLHWQAVKVSAQTDCEVCA